RLLRPRLAHGLSITQIGLTRSSRSRRGVTRTVRIAAHPEHTVETSPRFAVVGAGIGGLAAAFRLRTRGAAVTLFEAASRPGGVIRSERSEGFLLDFGPNTLVAR